MSDLISNVYDQKLLDSGYDSFTVEEKNNFIMMIARTKKMAITDITPEYLLQYHKELKVQDFSNKCEEDILAGFISPTNSHNYRLNRDDQLNMLGKYVFVKDDSTVSTVYWKAEDVGTQIPHTKDEFLTVVKEGFSHKEQTLYKLNTLRKQIKDCIADPEIVAIKW